jgi:sugar phosphate isomerase/epimerase
MMKLATSSTAFRGYSIEKIIQIAEEADLALEFSSGLPYREGMESLFLNASVERLPHNYFPAPRNPFVLNLASLDDAIWQRSFDHCTNSLKLAAQVGAPFYSVHAGFCIDPDPSHLGKGLLLEVAYPHSEYWDKFLCAVKGLVVIAEKFGVGFHVENNVLTKKNVLPDGSSPLLCVDSDECFRLMQEVGSDALGLHLDTAHLKVSANTLKFSKPHFISKVGDFIRSIHHSDNMGEDDTNDPVEPDYWFLEYMARFETAYHILEVHDQSLLQIYRQFDLLKKSAGDAQAHI